MIQLNCDMGEGCANDEALMPYIDAANIACGFHAGDEETMRQTLALAKRFGVAAGAHPSFPDREHFGRTVMHCTAAQVYDWVRQQVRLLQQLAAVEGIPVVHVKPHGALYNMAAANKGLASAIANAVRDCGVMVLIGLSGSELIRAGKEAGLKTKQEVFADRSYCDDGSLTPRGKEGAVFTDVQKVLSQVQQMASEGSVTTVSGKKIRLAAETICIHGDGPHAVEFAKAIHEWKI